MKANIASLWSNMFASKAGQLAGNHFITITENLDKIADLGRTPYGLAPRILYSGRHDLR